VFLNLLCKQGVAGSIAVTSTNHLIVNQSLTNLVVARLPQFGSNQKLLRSLDRSALLRWNRVQINLSRDLRRSVTEQCLVAVLFLFTPFLATGRDMSKDEANNQVELVAVDPEIRALLAEPLCSEYFSFKTACSDSDDSKLGTWKPRSRRPRPFQVSPTERFIGNLRCGTPSARNRGGQGMELPLENQA